MKQRNDKGNNKQSLPLAELVTFALFGAIMFVCKIALTFIPNVHLSAMFIAAFTLVYRAKALIPLYVYVTLDGLFVGFSMFWLPNLYIWLPLWGVFMLVRQPKMWLVMLICSLHGLSFGTLYAPTQALMFGLSLKGMFAWIIAGIPFDLVHASGNMLASTLALPLVKLLRRLQAAR
ncbi:MAG: hypothetical protein LBN40_02395 [Oscillospiraceae bacterium]|jgi:energy-coupling factor transport system substrate-specific component|nr:hypothetical protein [Oscillospiraceae bacterium]